MSLFALVGLIAPLVVGESSWMLRETTVAKKATVHVKQKTVTSSFFVFVVEDELKDDGVFICSETGETSIHTLEKFWVDTNSYTQALQSHGRLWFYAIDYTGDLKQLVDVTLYVEQPWGFLSPDVMPVLYICWVVVVVYIVGAVIWTINLIRHKAHRMIIHRVIQLALVIQLATGCLQGVIYAIGNAYHVSDEVYLITEFMQMLENWMILTLAMCFAAGVSIVRDKIPYKISITLICVPALFALLQSLLVSDYFMPYWDLTAVLVIGLFFGCSYILYIICYFYLLRQSMGILKEHLVMIMSRGIDPDTTPTARRISLLEKLRNYGMGVVLVFVMTALIRQIVVYWIGNLVLELMTLLLYIAICWICRARSKMAMQFGDDEEAYEIDDGVELKAWEPGVRLPPISQIRYSTTKIYAGNPESKASAAHSGRRPEGSP